MNSTTMIVLVILATSALVQGIAINSATKAGASATTSVSVNGNNGISVQSGYEGYVFSPQKARGGGSSGSSSSSISTWLALPDKILLLKSLLKSAPRYLMVYGSKAVKAVAHLFVALILGVVTTTAVCTYTPLCTITPGAELQAFTAQSLQERFAAMTRAYLSPETMNILTDLAKSAVQNNEEPTAAVAEEES